MIRKHATILLVALAASGIWSSTALAQAFPAKPLRILIGYPAGGPLDVVTRIVAQDTSAAFGQPVVVENRSGANGLIATDAVARAEPDGYTLLATASPFIVNPMLMDNVRTDPMRDFAPVSHFAVLPVVAVAPPDSKANSMHDLVNMAKAAPGAVTFASAGIGSPGHLAGELLQALTGIKMTHVPFRGSGPALVEVMGGRVALAFYPMTGLKEHVAQGRVKPLAIGGAGSRHPDYPSVPTMAEAGLPALTEVGVWLGIVAPAGTPAAIVTRLNEAIEKSLAKPEIKERLKGLGAIPVGGSPAKFKAFLEKDVERWSRVIKAAGIKAEGA
jgi:tripartite-type tricarboxylate transporter receptor subunit TctC